MKTLFQSNWHGYLYLRNGFNVSEFVRNFNLINLEEMIDYISGFGTKTSTQTIVTSSCFFRSL